MIAENKYHYIRLTRLFYPEPKVIWEGWAKMHIKGLFVTPETPYDWAEYTQNDLESDGKYIVEDYMMEILK